DDVVGRPAEPHQKLVIGQRTPLNRAVLRLTADVRGRNALRESGDVKPERRQPDTRLRIGNSLAIRGPEHQRVDSLAPEECLAAIAGRPEIHVVTRPAEHDVAVGRSAWRRTTVRSAEDDVLTGAAVNDVVTIQSKDDVIARPAGDDV